MEMIAQRVLTISATDAPQVLDWLQSTLRHALLLYNSHERNSWQAAGLLHVMMLQANDYQPLPQVQIQYMDPYTGGFARVALWAALRAMGNGRMDMLVGGDDEIDGVAWLLSWLAAAVSESYSIVAREDLEMPKYRKDDQQAGRTVVTTGAVIMPGASPVKPDPSRPGEDLVLIDVKKINLTLGHDGLKGEPRAEHPQFPTQPTVQEQEVGRKAFREAWYQYKYDADKSGMVKFTHEELARRLYLAVGTAKNYYNDWKAGVENDDTKMTPV